MNPLAERLALLFDLSHSKKDDNPAISFEIYMEKVAQFNCLGNREAKLKVSER